MTGTGETEKLGGHRHQLTRREAGPVEPGGQPRVAVRAQSGTERSLIQFPSHIDTLPVTTPSWLLSSLHNSTFESPSMAHSRVLNTKVALSGLRGKEIPEK